MTPGGERPMAPYVVRRGEIAACDAGLTVPVGGPPLAEPYANTAERAAAEHRAGRIPGTP